MSDSSCHAFTLRVRAFEPGIHVTKYHDGKRQVEIGPLPPNCRAAMLIPGEFKDEEFGPASTLLGGDLIWVDDGKGPRHRICRRKKGSGVLLRIMAGSLDFGLPPFARDLTFNQGGEGREAFLQFGRPKSGLRDQLFQLKEGEVVYVADRRTAIAEVVCLKDTLHMRPAKKEGVIELIREYGMREIQTVNGRVWAYHSLAALSANANVLDLLARQIPAGALKLDVPS